MTDTDGQSIELITARCCVVGGGPAGMVLGFLLARAGVEVVVLEKHKDFLRDFRGDTIHPSTLEILHELGILEEFLKRPHEEARMLSGVVGGETIPIADFSGLPTRCKFIAFMPQWDFLNFLAEHARRYPTFRLLMEAEVVGLREEQGRVIGVEARTPSGHLEVEAELTIGADGRHSLVRERAGLEVMNMGAPMDVLWMRLSRRPDDPDQPMGRFDRGMVFVMIYRGDYWQCGFIIPKGGFEKTRERGIASFRESIVTIAPLMADRVGELADWSHVKLLTVAVDRLKRWDRPGLVCIGDSAHAMSPIGGVGINLAIQDAVAAANLLAGPLVAGTLAQEVVQKIQRRRELPTRLTQRMQILIQNRVITRVIGGSAKLSVPWVLRLLRRWPRLRRIPGRIIGMGFRPEHVGTPDAFGSEVSSAAGLREGDSSS